MEGRGGRASHGAAGHLAAALTLALIGFLVFTGIFGQWPNIQQRSAAVSMLLAIGLLRFPARAADRATVPWYDWAGVLFLAGAAVNLHLKFWDIMMDPMAAIATADLVSGLAVTAIALEVSRRAIGLSFAVLVALAIAYALLGPYVPGRFAHSGVDWRFLAEHLYLSTSGLWGPLTDAFVSLIALFALFGAVMMGTGAGAAMLDLARYAGGRLSGGAAKIAVVSSAMVGTITGSSVTNVAMTGQLTIPMMIRLGYRPPVAGAIEATASSGGQITPPLMGAGLFLMADFLNTSVTSIMLAALMPAVLFYVGVLAAVHFDAQRAGIGRLPESELPDPRRLRSPRVALPLAAPFVVLFWMLGTGRPVEWAVLAATGVVAVAHVLAAPDLRALPRRLREVFDAAVGAGPALVTLGALIAAAAVLVGLIDLTGVGVKFTEVILRLSDGGLATTLLLSAAVMLVLGMGMPTTAAYVLSTAVIVVALQRVGLSPLQAHMFAFYVATLSALTPPVCAAVFVAAGIAGAPWTVTAWHTVRLASIKYLLPFLFALHPPLLMEGSALAVLITLGFAIIGTMLLSAAFSGWFAGPLAPLTRIVLGVASGAVLLPEPVTSLIGAGVAITVLLPRLRGLRKVPAA